MIALFELNVSKKNAYRTYMHSLQAILDIK